MITRSDIQLAKAIRVMYGSFRARIAYFESYGEWPEQTICD